MQLYIHLNVLCTIFKGVLLLSIQPKIHYQLCSPPNLINSYVHGLILVFRAHSVALPLQR